MQEAKPVPVEAMEYASKLEGSYITRSVRLWILENDGITSTGIFDMFIAENKLPKNGRNRSDPKFEVSLAIKYLVDSGEVDFKNGELHYVWPPKAKADTTAK